MKNLMTICCGIALLTMTGACAGTMTSGSDPSWYFSATSKTKGQAPATKQAKQRKWTKGGVNGKQAKQPSRYSKVWHGINDRHPDGSPGQRAARPPVAGVR